MKVKELKGKYGRPDWNPVVQITFETTKCAALTIQEATEKAFMNTDEFICTAIRRQFDEYGLKPDFLNYVIPKDVMSEPIKAISTLKQAVALSKWLLENFKPDHPRIKVFVGFEVKPAVYADCTHCETPKEALEMALRYDKVKKELDKVREKEVRNDGSRSEAEEEASKGTALEETC